MRILLNNNYTSTNDILFKAKKYNDIPPNELLSLIQQGYNKVDIAQKYAVPVSKVELCIKKNNFPTPLRYQKEILSKEIVTLLKKGLTLDEISQKLDCNKTKIYALASTILDKYEYKEIIRRNRYEQLWREKTQEEVLKRENSKARKEIFHEKIKDAIELIKIGITMKKAAEICKVSVKSIRKHGKQEIAKIIQETKKTEQVVAIIKHLNKGYTLEQVAKKLGYTLGEIKHHLGEKCKSIWDKYKTL